MRGAARWHGYWRGCRSGRFVARGYDCVVVVVLCHNVTWGAGRAYQGAAAYARATQLAPTCSAWCDLGVNLAFQARGAKARAGTSSGLFSLAAARDVGAPLAAAAARAFRAAAQLAPSDPRPWLCLGAVELRPLLAQHALLRAVKLSVGGAGPALTNLGLLCAEFGRFDLSRRAFVAAQCADPGNETMWIGQGMVHEQGTGDATARAGAAYISSLEVCPALDGLIGAATCELGATRASPGFHASSAVLEAPSTRPGGLGDCESAVFLLREACAWDGQHCTAWNALGIAEERCGRYSAAANAYRRALECVQQAATGGGVHADDVAAATAAVRCNIARAAAASGKGAADVASLMPDSSGLDPGVKSGTAFALAVVSPLMRGAVRGH